MSSLKPSLTPALCAPDPSQAFPCCTPTALLLVPRVRCASALPGLAVRMLRASRTHAQGWSLPRSRAEPEAASPHVSEVREDEQELGQAPLLLLQTQAGFGHQVDQGVYDLVQDSVDMFLLFQRFQRAGQKGVHA